MRLVLIQCTDRHVYRELAKLTDNKQLRMVYAKMNARAYRLEMKKAAVGAAHTKGYTDILPERSVRGNGNEISHCIAP